MGHRTAGADRVGLMLCGWRRVVRASGATRHPSFSAAIARQTLTQMPRWVAMACRAAQPGENGQHATCRHATSGADAVEAGQADSRRRDEL